MIPIFSILAVFLAIINFILFVKLYLSYCRTNLESIGNFSKIFLLISLFWGFIALPQLIINDPKLIQIFLHLSTFFGYLAYAYFLLILLELFYPRISAKPLLITVISFGIILLIFNILDLRPAFIHSQNNFIFSSENQNPLVYILSGSLFGAVEIIAALLFFLNGLKAQEKEIRFRALLLGTAQIFIFFALAVRLVFGFLLGNVFISTLAAFLLGGVFSTTFVIIAVFFVKPESERRFYKKIYKEEK